MSAPLRAYERALQQKLDTGDATEHTHRPTLVRLLETLAPDVQVINEPKRIECGAPDLAIRRPLNGVDATIGYIETKEVGANLDDAERSEQLLRYRNALPNLILTNYREFRWYLDGERRAGAHLSRPDELQSLLLDFLARAPEPIADAHTLAQRLARLAYLIRDTLIATFEQGKQSSLLNDLRTTVAKTLLPDIEKPEHLSAFADMLAQTLAYGLFAARCYHTPPHPFTRAAAAREIPRTNPFLRQLFNTLNDPALEEEPFVAFVDDLVSLLNCADMSAVLQQFQQRTGREDAVVHFYETFLHAYDPRLRELRGVYYTPEPVVDFLVRAVHGLLQTEFGLPDGLAALKDADTPLYILDPACGTGSFLAHILQFVQETLQQQGLGGLWNDETRARILERLFGFELLMAPYTIAHLKLGLMLNAHAHRLGVYLTNTLEMPSEQIEMQLGPWRVLSEEAAQANRIKRDTPILVVIGNPPYSGHSANRVPWLEQLIRTDYYPKDARKEQNPKMLLDDYVKFIRWAQWRLERTGQGILAFITNHGYLDAPTFRGMRRALLNAFDTLYLVDLHGNLRRKETAPDGSPDENVFDIQQGVALLIAVKRAALPDASPSTDSALESADSASWETPDGQTLRVFYAEVRGRRAVKYAFLRENTLETVAWTLLTPRAPLYLFVPQDDALQAEYEQGWSLTDIFRVHSTGVKTHRDHFVIDFDKDTLLQRIREFRDLSIPDETLRRRCDLRDTRDWKLTPNREQLAQDPHWQSYLQPILYRPFDVRWIYFTPHVVELPREEVMLHMVRGANVALIAPRQVAADFHHAFVTIYMSGVNNIGTAGRYGAGFHFPLYLYHQEADGAVVREANLRAEFVRALGVEASSEQVLAYIYAVLHAPSYRARYAEFLRRDFPRIPLPRDAEQFHALSALGQELIDLHLLRAPRLSQSPVKFPVAGSNTVEKGFPRYANGRVWINKTQYFEGVREAVWRFQVGGYQVCDKWLKDRRERTLSNAEIETYRKIVYALDETLRLMDAIEQRLV